MVFIKIYAKTTENKKQILDWMFEHLYLGHNITLLDLIARFENDLIIEDNDMLYYWQVGYWMCDDIMHELYTSKNNSHDLQLPSPHFHKEFMWHDFR